MSETVRISEARRRLSIQCPDTPLSRAESERPATHAEMAEQFGQLAARAATDLHRRIRGLGQLFGEDAARPVADAAEQFTELHYTTLEQHGYAREVTGRYIERLRNEYDEAARRVRAERGEAFELLDAALEDFERRQARTKAALRRDPPAWVVGIRRLLQLPDDEAPF